MYERKCIGCGESFSTITYTQLRCRPDCGRQSRNQARTKASDRNDLQFVGVDGEGVDRPDGTHEYVMLSVGRETLYQDGKQLTLGAILSFLYEQYTKQPKAAFIGFFLGYDFIQWEKLLPEDRARLLLTNAGIAARKTRRISNPNPYPDPVVWEGWELDIMAGRRFKLRPHVHYRSQYTDHCRNRTCMAEVEASLGDEYDFVEGELDWCIPDTEPEDSELSIDHETFWQRFGPPRGKVGSNVKSRTYGWMYICDTGSFWQTSFLNVIRPAAWGDNPVLSDGEYDLIAKGKADRGTVADYGSVDYYEDMRRYNILENDILARVTQRLNEGFMNERIPIKIGRNEWYGPGRAAQLWLDQLHERHATPSAVAANKSLGVRFNPRERANERGLLSLDCYDSVPSWFREAAQQSYYGGWFEQFTHGHCGDVWEYDINSAYPFIIASLPCLHTSDGHSGEYSSGGMDVPPPSESEGRYTLLYATLRGTNAYIGAGPYRDTHGAISRPQIVKGWYWQHEVEASKRAGLIDSVEVEEWVSYQACGCGRPFDCAGIGIGSLYQLRLDFGKNTPQGKSAKLVYNSAYGKTAQSVGTPKYSNPIYASLITSGCRSLILDAIATHPRGASAVTMVATDGVYFLSKHPGLELSKTELGKWDETFKPNITQFMPGVYWDDHTREAIGLGNSPKLKSRGVNARDLAKEIGRLDHQFALSHQSLRERGIWKWPEIQFKVGFLLDSAKSALHRNKWNTAGRVQHDTVRSISSNPASKRHPSPYRDDRADGIVRSKPYDRHAVIESIPYDRSFGYTEEPIGDLFNGAVERDGSDPLQYWRDLIAGGEPT